MYLVESGTGSRSGSLVGGMVAAEMRRAWHHLLGCAVPERVEVERRRLVKVHRPLQ